MRDEERIAAFLCLWMGIAQSYGRLPPSYARDLAAALATIDPDASCEHPRPSGPPPNPPCSPGTARWFICTRRTTTPTPP
ncbi:hypothetical protein [Streptomyces sp. NPDC090021]|uniref:hypothetical protein n=1 Tax=Streptomyces sp. NPDC090021 TaxID=3365919 RepID=UPI003811B5E3